MGIGESPEDGVSDIDAYKQPRPNAPAMARAIVSAANAAGKPESPHSPMSLQEIGMLWP
jgi:hypothetical protein